MTESVTNKVKKGFFWLLVINNQYLSIWSQPDKTAWLVS